MTRARIVEGLELLVLGLANPGSRLSDPPEGWSLYEWAYVKGIASGDIMRLRDHLVGPRLPGEPFGS